MIAVPLAASELLVIAVGIIAVLIVGPRRSPRMRLARYLRVRRYRQLRRDLTNEDHVRWAADLVASSRRRKP